MIKFTVVTCTYNAEKELQRTLDSVQRQTLNKSIDRATGDYLVFMNAGDTFPTADTLEYVEGCVGEGELLPGVLYGDTDIVDEMGHFLRHRRLAPPKKLTWRSFIWGMLVCHQSFYARTDIAREIHYDLHYRYSADVDWCIRIMRSVVALRLENEPLVWASMRGF